MTDKAVSTEDLCIDLPRNASLEAARLEAVIKTLIENKVETLKNARKSSSITSSPKSLFNKLRGNSTSTVSSKDKEEIVSVHLPKKCTEHRKRKLTQTSPGNSHLPLSDEEQSAFMLDSSENCCCRQNPNEIQIHVDEDFISLNLEHEENEKKAQRKRRRRRKHRKHLKMAAMAVQVNELKTSTSFKDLDEDELSRRARITIALTAFLLLFMCLLLVGITLRMAPLIDDMVRKENEELMNSLDDSLQNNFTVPNSHK